MKFLIIFLAIIGMCLAAGGRRPTSRPASRPAARPAPRATPRPAPRPIARATPRPHVSSFQRASVQSNDILSKSYNLNPDGSYGYEYETANGISASENGVGGQYAKGAYEYTSPEGEHVVVQYTADENGFQPSGSHVPQVPPYILRALEYIRTHPHPEYQNY